MAALSTLAFLATSAAKSLEGEAVNRGLKFAENLPVVGRAVRIGEDALGLATANPLAALTSLKTGFDVKNLRDQASATQREADYSAGILEQNAAYAKEQASDALERGKEAVSDRAQQESLLKGEQRVAFAAQGVNINAGSATDVVNSDAWLAAKDEQRLRNNAAREAHGFTVQSDDYLAQAQLTRLGGANRAKALRRQSLSTLLGGASELANVYAHSPKGVVGHATSSRWQGNANDGDYTASGARRGAEL